MLDFLLQVSPSLPLSLAQTGGAVNVALTFGEGLLSFGSPCVLPLVPGYLSFISGVSVAQVVSAGDVKNAQLSWADTRRVLTATLVFIAGFTTVFLTIFGLTYTVAEALGPDLKTWIQLVAGLAVIVMGLHFIGVFRLGFLNMEKRFHFSGQSRPAGLLGAYLVGCAFAAGWTPCVGPLLGGALNKAIDTQTALDGLGLMLVYCAGLGIPFLLAGLFISKLLGFIARVRKHYQTIQIASGVLLVAVGVLIITNNMTELTRLMGRFQTIQ